MFVEIKESRRKGEGISMQEGSNAGRKFDGASGRPTRIDYPNSQRTEIDYYPNGEDHRLRRIRNLPTMEA